MGTSFSVRKEDAGFTLVELAIVLVIAGIMMTLGYYSWGMVVEGRKNAATLFEMNKVKACIMGAIVADSTYPNWTATRTQPITPTVVVDRCLDSRVDAHTNPIYFIEGVRSTAQGGGSLAGNCILPDSTRANNDPCSPNYTTTPPGPPPITPQTGTGASASFATDRDGVVIQDVAFILVSFGRSGRADNNNLSLMFPAGTLSASILATGTQPSFARTAADGNDYLTETGQTGVYWGDDVYLMVTYQEILGAIVRARGLTGHSGL